MHIKGPNSFSFRRKSTRTQSLTTVGDEEDISFRMNFIEVRSYSLEVGFYLFLNSDKQTCEAVRTDRYNENLIRHFSKGVLS